MEVRVRCGVRFVLFEVGSVGVMLMVILIVSLLRVGVVFEFGNWV